MTPALTAAHPRLLLTASELATKRSRVDRFFIVQATAKDLNVHPNTVWRWLRELVVDKPAARPRCLECGEYRRVHKLGGHPFVYPTKQSRARYERWSRDYMTDGEKRAFVDALRQVLGLPGLYNRELPERFRVFPDPDYRSRKLLKQR